MAETLDVWRVSRKGHKVKFVSHAVLLRARQKGDSKREKPDPERTFSQIFADFR